MKSELQEKYARLIVKSGLNIQKNQILVINSPIECAYFARIVAKIAYIEGAKEVVVRWNDDLLTKIKYINAKEEVFDEFPSWQKDFYVTYANQGAAFLSISASDPDIMKEVDPARIMKAVRASNSALKEYRDRIMGDQNVWCVIALPTEAWAHKLFPELQKEEAIQMLWEAIFKAVRINGNDPIEAWDIHKKNLKASMDYLNYNKFRFLHYKNSTGTDLIVELPESHIWLAGTSVTPDGIEFIPNIPTEEVFTLPKKTGVNGTVVSSKPLNYNGNIIDNFSLTFKDGRIVDCSAENGIESLKSLIATDEGSHYLGEVALVPFDSPISKQNILFYNTLFDENASCHLAIGKAYPTCVKNYQDFTDKALDEIGVNDSLVHVDFMIGTADLDIAGITYEGKEIDIFKKGNFVY